MSTGAAKSQRHFRMFLAFQRARISKVQWLTPRSAAKWDSILGCSTVFKLSMALPGTQKTEYVNHNLRTVADIEGRRVQQIPPGPLMSSGAARR
jgi:hypothetical protein